MKRIIYFLCLLSLVSCNDFVDVIPKGSVIPSSVDDLGMMINNVQPSLSSTLSLMTDDAALPYDDPFYSITKSKEEHVNAYLWGSPYIYNVNSDDPFWNGLYKSIYVCNYILENINSASEGAEFTRNNVRGAALVHRATSYFALNQLYAKQYDSTTAETDLSVPLRLESDINKIVPRSTVATVYAQMIKDLEESKELLSETIGVYNNQPSRPATLALLARIYLFMGDYDKAYDYANEAIEIIERKGERFVLDYTELKHILPGNPFWGIEGYPSAGQEYSSSELIYYRSNDYSWGVYSDELMELLGENDTRFTIFACEPIEGVVNSYYDSSQKPKHIGVDVYEIYITKAEAALRKSNPDLTETVELLNSLRVKRILPEAYYDITETDEDKVLELLMDERHAEYMLSPMRFFDMKRYDGDVKTAKVYERVSQGKTYKLEINSPYFVLAIPQKIVNLGGYEQNEATGR